MTPGQPPPWYLLALPLLVSIGMLVPLVYLVLRAFDGAPGELSQIVFRRRNLSLLVNTLLLNLGVVIIVSLLALPLAWLTTRSDLAGKQVVSVLGVLPLAIPGYVMAYTLLGLSGPYGTAAALFGIQVPRFTGYWGALIALSLYTLPYLFLQLRAGLTALDPAYEETGRSLGYGAFRVFFFVVFPQLLPAFLAGTLLVSLHVLGDFGVVSLMRYETFSYALFLQYTASYDRVYAAWLALMLLGLTGGLIYAEAWLLRTRQFYRTGSGTARIRTPIPLGLWAGPAYLFIISLTFLSVAVPLITIGFWLSQRPIIAAFAGLLTVLGYSLSACVPAALFAAALAVPVAYLGTRYPSPLSRLLERLAYVGYATPSLAFALALIFFTLSIVPTLYQTLPLLISAYTLHFLAEAVGPVRNALYQATPRLEEAARTLGYGPIGAFRATTLPLLRSGLIVSATFVFLSTMKELPITFLLAPLGFETLAVNIWGYTTEAMFAEAAPYALTILLFSTLFVWLLLAQERRGG
jgi:iron(III) transport system permease protein